MSEENKEDEIPWTCRTMTHEDIDECLKIWAQAGFNADRKTCVCALYATPGGLYVAELKGTKEIIGTCSANLVRPDTAFVGFYVVKPEYQGRGVGRDLWSKTYDRVYPTMNIGLSAVPHMADKYRSCGMRQEDPHSHLIYSLVASSGDKERVESLRGTDQLDADCQLVVINDETEDELFKQLSHYNEVVLGFCREKWLNLQLKGKDSPLTLAVVKTNKGPQSDINLREIIGFGCVRHDNFKGASIGPLYAESSELSEIIMRSLLERFEIAAGRPYTAIIFKGNNHSTKLLEKLQFKCHSEYTRLFSRFVPQADQSKIYLAHSADFTLF